METEEERQLAELDPTTIAEEPEEREITLYDLVAVQNVLKLWGNLKRTHQDGLALKDQTTLNTVTQTLLKRCKADKLEPVKSNIDCDTMSLTLEVKINDKVHTIEG